MSPVVVPEEMDTLVVFWRVAQYIVDSLIVGVGVSVLAFLYLVVPTTSDGAIDSSSPIFWIVTSLVGVLGLGWVVYVWVLRPLRHDGQTYAMQAVGIRIVGSDGTPASLGQLVVRALLLFVDTLAGGLVGFVAMALSKRNQRIGDMAARTVVCRVVA